MVAKGQPMAKVCHKMTDPKVLSIFIGKTSIFYLFPATGYQDTLCLAIRFRVNCTILTADGSIDNVLSTSIKIIRANHTMQKKWNPLIVNSLRLPLWYIVDQSVSYLCNALYFGEWSDGSLAQIQKAQVVQQGGDLLSLSMSSSKVADWSQIIISYWQMPASY